MAEAKLTITTNSRQVVEDLKQVSDGLKDVTRSQKELVDNAKQTTGGFEKTAGAIKETQKISNEFRMSLQEQRDWDKKAMQNQMDMYVKVQTVRKKQTEEEIENLKKVGKETDELTKKVENFIKKWGAVGVAIALATKVFKDVAKAIADTNIGMKALTVVGELWQQLTYNIATGNFNMANSFRIAAQTAQELNKYRESELKHIIDIAKYRKEYNRLYFEASDRSKGDIARYDALNQAMLAHNILIDAEIKKTREQLSAVQLQRQNRFNSYKLRKQEAELIAQIIDLEGRAYSETKRLEMQLSILLKGFFDDYKSARENMDKAIQEWEETWADEILERQKKYQEKSLELLDKYNQARINMLSGQEQLDAIRDLSLKEIDQLKKDLAKFGAITEEQEKMFKTLGMEVTKAFYTGMAEEVVISQKDVERFIVPAILATITDSFGLIKKDVEKERKTIEDLAEKDTIWDNLGLSDEDKDAAIDALEDGIARISSILGDIFEQSVDDAGRRRDLLDTQISELQHELEIEADLYEEGYANNVDAKRKELDSLKKLRDKAIADEEKAIKKQQTYEKIIQTTSLLTSVAQILKSATKAGIVGLALAPFAIATLWAIWGRAKTQGATLAEGGSGSDTGLITGKRHSQGGESLLDHVEVEHGEAWGVLSRPATEKYGEVFHDMVSSFNKNEMPNFMPVTNNVNIDNKGPNSRLDNVIKEQRKLNESLLKQSQITFSGNKRIIRTGNKVRIIG